MPRPGARLERMRPLSRRGAPVAVGFIKGFGLRSGALASSVAHDSHNIVAVGVDDAALADAVNRVIAHRGGISVVDGGRGAVLPRPQRL